MKENGARESVGIKKYDNHLTAPTLIIQEGQRINNKIAFPNVYHILQCLTTKNAKDSFDLERYEVMGDCYLKLIVVMKIYLKFTNTNEGNMAELKSQRVSIVGKMGQKRLFNGLTSKFQIKKAQQIFSNLI